MQHIIQNEKLQVTIDEKGAELISVLYNGKEQLWQNQTGDWAGHAPMLFPVCGHFKCIYEGKEYPLPAHGFARKKQFTLVEKTADTITFTLSSDESTKAMYPFDFQLFTRYELKGAKIEIIVTIKNKDEKTMLFSLGGHESYMLSAPLEEYKLVFPTVEELINLENDDEGYLTKETTDFGTSNEYAFKATDLSHDETIIFKDLKSESVKLCKKTGEEVYEITFKGFSKLLLWRPIGAQTLCIEPWLNLPDWHGDETAFENKEGVTAIPVGEEKTYVRTLEYKE